MENEILYKFLEDEKEEELEKLIEEFSKYLCSNEKEYKYQKNYLSTVYNNFVKLNKIKYKKYRFLNEVLIQIYKDTELKNVEILVDEFWEISKLKGIEIRKAAVFNSNKDSLFCSIKNGASQNFLTFSLNEKIDSIIGKIKKIVS